MLMRTTLALCCLALLALPGRASAQDRLLFAGNSYTFYSGGLEAMVDSLLEEATGATVDAQSVTAGGYRLIQHLADADGTNGDRPLRQALVTGPDTDWNLVVLQEQSQIPGFPRGQIDWIDSRDSAVGLNSLIEPTGAHTMFFVTWGRRDGDSRNLGRFPDFRTMQGLLTDGYLAYREATSTEARPTFAAPVGPAFELVYDDVLEAGDVPEDSGSSFHRLYAGDGSHPSTEGSYLAACVFFAAYSGVSPVDLEWAPGGVDADRRDYLQAIAAEVVFDTTADWPYPWMGDGGGDADVGGEDVGPGDVGPGDVGPGDVGSDDTGSDTGSDTADEDTPADAASDTSGEDAPTEDVREEDSAGETGADTPAEEDGPVSDAVSDSDTAAADEDRTVDRPNQTGGSDGGCASAANHQGVWFGMLALLPLAHRRR